MKKRIHRNKGFTLVEMLVVIAIIAVLVAIVVPTISSAMVKAKAATDAANLRGVFGMANNFVLKDNAAVLPDSNVSDPGCKTFPDAVMKMAYIEPCFFDVYFVVNDSEYYSVSYFAALASTGAAPEDYDNRVPEVQGKTATFYPVAAAN